MLRFVAALTVLTALTACETTKGVGRDVEDAGEAIQDAAS
ncbi:entericidin A/B family lipoprotein [Roseobacter sinensis]|uniref:Entericidin A/B family lipoprotein n=1 Tax=Roseobacter sinensis TaxID=2931391 RepID=A0ABT3BB61_9RHOB|nr:entericidin A/B family lipoprotein [Roseobacter sp. WL0113]MCV3270814.1 entericidin A/B family lipoprotein [Roseobacter sp. WL0113]